MRSPNLRGGLAAGHRGRLAAGIALIAAVAALIAVVLSAGSTNSRGSSSSAAQASGSTTVERRNLVQTDTQSGTLGYANPRTVYNRLSGTITWLPNVGQVIKPGETLYEVNGQPVILFDGTTPAYRDLDASDTAGQDILQLNRNLVALGFNPDGIVVDDIWQAATTAGVDLLQASLGETETGSLSLGQIVFLPGDQLVSNVQATLGDGGSGGTGAAAASTRPAAAGAEFVSLTATSTTTTTPTTTTPVRTKPKPTKPKPTKRGTGPEPSGSPSSPTLTGLTALLKAEAAQLKAAAAALKAAKASSSKNSPSSSSKTGGSASSSKSSSNSSSSGGGSASAVLQTASTQLTATVQLDASKQSEAKVGEKVTVQLPAGNTVNGVITAVSPIAQSSSSSGNGASSSAAGSNGGSASSAATIPVTIKFKRHLRGAGLDQAAVSVNFIQAVAHNVLPVTALLATSGGGYAIQEATAPHKLIPVTTGLFAAGYAEISGQGIYPGLPVTNSQG